MASRTRCQCVPGGVGMGNPALVPLRALFRVRVARCGLAGGRPPGGGALRRHEGRPRSCACPPPAARPWGGLLGSAAHLLWARVCGCGGPALSLWGACSAGGCVRRYLREAVLGGWPSTVVRGVWRQALSLSWLPVIGGG